MQYWSVYSQEVGVWWTNGLCR